MDNHWCQYCLIIIDNLCTVKRITLAGKTYLMFCVDCIWSTKLLILQITWCIWFQCIKQIIVQLLYSHVSWAGWKLFLDTADSPPTSIRHVARYSTIQYLDVLVQSQCSSIELNPLPLAEQGPQFRHALHGHLHDFAFTTLQLSDTDGYIYGFLFWEIMYDSLG